MDSNSSSYMKVPAADALQPVEAVAIPVKSGSCSDDIGPGEDTLSFEHDWDRYQQQEKTEKLGGLYVSSFAMVIGYMVFFFVLGLNHRGSEWLEGAFPLFLLLVTALSIGVYLREIYILKTNEDLVPCPETRIRPRHGLEYIYSGQENESTGSILIPFSEIEDIAITLPKSKIPCVTITTKATGDGAEYVQSGVPKFDSSPKFRLEHQSQNGQSQPFPVTEMKIRLTIKSLREPYIFKRKLLEYTEQGSKQKLEKVINRIDEALSVHCSVDDTFLLSKIRDELKSFNGIV